MARAIKLRDGETTYTATIADDGSVTIDGGAPIAIQADGEGRVRVGASPPRVAWVAADGEARWVFLGGQAFRFDIETAVAPRRSRAQHGSLSSPMPATVLRLLTEPGARVTRGDTLIILEAMKMELPIRATADGVVTDVRCREGELVQPGTILVEIDEGGAEA